MLCFSVSLNPFNLYHFNIYSHTHMHTNSLANTQLTHSHTNKATAEWQDCIDLFLSFVSKAVENRSGERASSCLWRINKHSILSQKEISTWDKLTSNLTQSYKVNTLWKQNTLGNINRSLSWEGKKQFYSRSNKPCDTYIWLNANIAGLHQSV